MWRGWLELNSRLDGGNLWEDTCLEWAKVQGDSFEWLGAGNQVEDGQLY